jgi:hypothetical protein
MLPPLLKKDAACNVMNLLSCAICNVLDPLKMDVVVHGLPPLYYDKESHICLRKVQLAMSWTMKDASN